LIISYYYNFLFPQIWKQVQTRRNGRGRQRNLFPGFIEPNQLQNGCQMAAVCKTFLSTTLQRIYYIIYIYIHTIHSHLYFSNYISFTHTAVIIIRRRTRNAKIMSHYWFRTFRLLFFLLYHSKFFLWKNITHVSHLLLWFFLRIQKTLKRIYANLWEYSFLK